MTTTRIRLLQWAAVVGSALAIVAVSPPEGITVKSWRLLAIFTATIVGSIVRPVPAGAIVFLAICAMAITGTMAPAEALGGYADPIVWMVLCAFFIARGVIKTGLGRRIAFLFIRAIGKSSVGLGYALVFTDNMLASIIPSNSARAGGIVFPVAKALAEAYDSKAGPSARRLGAYLMTVVYQCDVVNCAMFLTGQASNVLIAKFAMETAGFEMTYSRWWIGGVVPGLISLLVIPPLLARTFPPEIRHTPEAATLAASELRRMGSMGRDERMMLAVFVLVAALWMTSALHSIHYAVVAMLGVGALVLTGVLEWNELAGEAPAWDIFIWYGGVVKMAEALAATGIIRKFAEWAALHTSGWHWGAALMVLALIYFYAHYGFASITAHATAMFIPFLTVVLAAGAPPAIAVLGLAYFSNLSAGLTHYGTTPAPIYFGSGYVTQRQWWTQGLLMSFVTITIWTVAGLAWWKVLGWW